LGLDYALKGDKAKDAANMASGDGLGWRGWTRIVAFTATAAFGTLAVMKHLDAADAKDEISKLKKNKPNVNDKVVYTKWYNKYEKEAKAVKDNESSRNLFGICAGVSAVAATMTFVF
jgi:hypothetical protein